MNLALCSVWAMPSGEWHLAHFVDMKALHTFCSKNARCVVHSSAPLEHEVVAAPNAPTARMAAAVASAPALPERGTSMFASLFSRDARPRRLRIGPPPRWFITGRASEGASFRNG